MRTLMVVMLALACVAPSFAAYNFAAATAVPVGDFGVGIVVPPAAGNAGSPVMLWVIPGDPVVSNATARANQIVARLRASAPFLMDVAGAGQVYPAKVVGDVDYAVVVEVVQNGNWVKRELVTVDKGTAKPYGASPKALAIFWAARLKALSMVPSMPSNAPGGNWMAAIPAPWCKALMANWRDWKATKDWGWYVSPFSPY